MKTTNQMLPSYSKKSKGSKLPEELTPLLCVAYEIGKLNEHTNTLVTENLLKANSLDQQIDGLRNLVLISSSSKSECDNSLYDKETIENLADVITYLFFQLKSNSCLKSVIANAINKVAKPGSTNDEIFVRSFNKYITDVIFNVLSSTTNKDGSRLVTNLAILQNKAIVDFTSCVMRSLENNCHVSILATTRNVNRIVNVVENICLIPFPEYWKSEIKQVNSNDEENIPIILSKIIRLTLSLQSLSRESLSSSFLDTLLKFQQFYYFQTNDNFKFDTETESNLALLTANEAKAAHIDDYIEFMVEYVNLNLSSTQANNGRSVHFVVQTVNALAIASNPEYLFEPSQEQYSERSNTRLEKIHNMLERWSVLGMDSQLCVAHALANYNLVNSIQKYLMLKHDGTQISNDVSMILQKMEMYVWTILCHNTDKVKHIARNILNSLVIIYREYLPTVEKLHQLIRKCMVMPWEQKSKYLALLSIFKHTSSHQSARVKAANDVSELYPDMPSIVVNQLHSVHPSLVGHCSDLYEVFICNDFVRISSQKISNQPSKIVKDEENIAEEKWFDRWYTPILNLKSNDMEKISVPTLEKLINTGMKLSNLVLYRIIDYYQNYDKKDDVNREGKILQLVIIALKTQKIGKNIDIFEDPESAMRNILTNSCFHFDDEIRIKAVELLVCSKSSKQELRQYELEMILSTISTNMIPDLRSTRQDFIHCIKKMFNRMIEGLNTSKRIEVNPSSLLTTELTIRYDDFLSRLGKYLFSCMFEGATSSRRGIALEVINMIIVTFIGKEKKTGIDLCGLERTLYTKDSATILVKCLEDPYEQNKEIALKCLCEFPNHILSSHCQNEVMEYVEQKWDQITLLRCSHKPPETVTAAYILRYLIEKFSANLSVKLHSILKTKQDNLGLSAKLLQQKNSITKLYYQILDHLIISFKQQIEIARVDLIKASEEGPMYGTLFCIRTILGILRKFRLSIHEAKVITDWVLDLIKLLIGINTIVASVVNNDSPEGHLPMDFTITKLSNEDNLDVSNTSSQKLLLCAWRTSKEVSLLLGDISIYCNTLLETTKDYKTLKIVQVKLAEYFGTHLSEVKHRGAFEQAYVGFCNYCISLWEKVKITDINSKEHENAEKKDHFLSPADLLQDILRSLKQNDDITRRYETTSSEITNKQPIKIKELCVTRRSAGVPYLIQGIITTDPDHKWLEYTFKELFNLVKNGTLTTQLPNNQNYLPIESNASERTIHACNILRVLFRDSLLGDAVLPFVAKGVIIALNGFKSSLWSIRNSATLLFSALITRIFGVKRSKNELSKKNCMTSRSFFLRYPDLYNFLLEEITIAAKKLQRPQLCDKVHGNAFINPDLENSIFPILLILAKLEPPPLSESEDHYKISSFFPPLLVCCGSSIYKVRELASMAYVTLHPIEDGIAKSLTERIQRMSTILQKSMSHVNEQMEVEDHNTFHGYLLQAKHVLLKGKEVEDAATHIRDKASIATYEKAIRLSCDIMQLKSSNKSLENAQDIKCMVVQATALQILNELLSYYHRYKLDDATFNALKLVHGTLHELWERETSLVTASSICKMKQPGHILFVELLIRAYLFVNEYMNTDPNTNVSHHTYNVIREEIASNGYISILLAQLTEMKENNGK